VNESDGGGVSKPKVTLFKNSPLILSVKPICVNWRICSITTCTMSETISDAGLVVTGGPM